MSDITIENFESELIQASMQQPVLLDIWAPWCGPCKTLGPLLDKLETAYGGRFKLAKLNSDDQPEIAGQLSQAFGVRSIPFCVMFDKGQPVDGFVGALPEAQIREFLDRHVPSAEAQAAEDEAAAADRLEAAGDHAGALERLQHALATDPGNATVRLDLVKALGEAGRVDEARATYAPLAGNAIVDARLAAFGRWLDALAAAPAARDLSTLDAAIAGNKRDFEARFERARRLWAEAQPTAAMDELAEILMRDKAWNDQAARKDYVAILELMSKPAPKAAAAEATGAGKLELTGKQVVQSADPVVDSYRRKLSMLLF